MHFIVCVCNLSVCDLLGWFRCLNACPRPANSPAPPLITCLPQMLGLEVCADTLVGDEMHRGISGGQRKRVTTGNTINKLPFITIFIGSITLLGLLN